MKAARKSVPRPLPRVARCEAAHIRNALGQLLKEIDAKPSNDASNAADAEQAEEESMCPLLSGVDLADPACSHPKAMYACFGSPTPAASPHAAAHLPPSSQAVAAEVMTLKIDHMQPLLMCLIAKGGDEVTRIISDFLQSSDTARALQGMAQEVATHGGAIEACDIHCKCGYETQGSYFQSGDRYCPYGQQFGWQKECICDGWIDDKMAREEIQGLCSKAATDYLRRIQAAELRAPESMRDAAILAAQLTSTCFGLDCARAITEHKGLIVETASEMLLAVVKLWAGLARETKEINPAAHTAAMTTPIDAAAVAPAPPPPPSPAATAAAHAPPPAPPPPTATAAATATATATVDPAVGAGLRQSIALRRIFECCDTFAFAFDRSPGLRALGLALGFEEGHVDGAAVATCEREDALGGVPDAGDLAGSCAVGGMSKKRGLDLSDDLSPYGCQSLELLDEVAAAAEGKILTDVAEVLRTSFTWTALVEQYEVEAVKRGNVVMAQDAARACGKAACWATIASAPDYSDDSKGAAGAAGGERLQPPQLGMAYGGVTQLQRCLEAILAQHWEDASIMLDVLRCALDHRMLAVAASVLQNCDTDAVSDSKPNDMPKIVVGWMAQLDRIPALVAAAELAELDRDAAQLFCLGASKAMQLASWEEGAPLDKHGNISHVWFVAHRLLSVVVPAAPPGYYYYPPAKAQQEECDDGFGIGLSPVGVSWLRLLFMRGSALVRTAAGPKPSSDGPAGGACRARPKSNNAVSVILSDLLAFLKGSVDLERLVLTAEAEEEEGQDMMACED